MHQTRFDMRFPSAAELVIIHTRAESLRLSLSRKAPGVGPVHESMMLPRRQAWKHPANHVTWAKVAGPFRREK
jgi:hypothetical protein